MLCGLGLAALLAGCGTGPLAVDVPTAPERDVEACRALVDALPDEVHGQERREVTGADGRAAAWGDPAIVLRCGVPQPDDFSDTATCIEVNGTGWYVPDAVLAAEDQTLDVTMTAVGFRPRVEVVVPGEDRPEGFTDAAGALGSVVSDRLREVQPCR